MTRDDFPFKQVIVVGGTGQTGQRVLELAVEHAKVKLVATSRGGAAGDKWGSRVQWRVLDLEAETAVLDRQLQALAAGLRTDEPTLLILAAAFTNVDACETDPERCQRVNVRNTIEVLKWARAQFNAVLAFYSTDYVFDGTAGPYAETSPRKAISEYGRSKVAVEEWLEKNAPQSLVVRTTGVYDYLPGASNFLMQMLTLWGQGKTTRIPSDQFANPVWAHDLARATLELVALGATGCYHVAGASQLARSEFAALITRIFGLNSQLIEPVKTQALGQKARRPLQGGLLCTKLNAQLGWVPGGAAEVLESLKWLHAR